MIRSEIKDAFFARLDRLRDGDRVALRRSAGRLLQNAPMSAYQAFVGCVPFEGAPGKDRWFLPACVYCDQDSKQPVTDLPVLYQRMVIAGELGGSDDRRWASILSTGWDDSSGLLVQKLAMLIRRMHSAGRNVDCTRLIDDLVWWNHPNRLVQMRWAQAVAKEAQSAE